MKQSYCLGCGKEVDNNTIKCECGDRHFVYGEKDTFKMIDSLPVCKCGNKDFNMTAHLDYTNKYINNYKCSKCGNIIGTESYRDEESRMFWS